MTQYGAIVHGGRGGGDACASVEKHSNVVLLAAVHGDLATAALESLKSAFTPTTSASALIAAAPPPPYAAGVAVLLLAQGRAHVAVSGSGSCYRERNAKLEVLTSGDHDVQDGDVLVASSHGTLGTGVPLLASPAPRQDHGSEFRNDELDDALEAALVARKQGFIAIAAALVILENG